MPHTAIKVEGLSKMYRIGAQQLPYQTLRDSITQAITAPVRRVSNMLRGRSSSAAELTEEFWALKDISFELKEGEVLGIIGRNGAGKSTLLKILSRITEPTNGTAETHGRVGSLLEVGTGFHPELTGRENIYLNGAILGMPRLEINQRFDEIVAFAEVEQFIDTPVKHYSSGMRLRLGFAVAAHLEPDILIVDEVLAVGDAAFQKKCLGKMSDVAGAGRTVLFVSHNMAAVTRLCSSVAWLKQGQLHKTGEPHLLVSEYLDEVADPANGQIRFKKPATPKDAYLKSIELIDNQGDITTVFDVASPIRIQISFSCEKDFKEFHSTVLISTDDGSILLATTSRDYDNIHQPFAKGHYCTELVIPNNFLSEGIYYVTVSIVETSLEIKEEHEHILRFDVRGNPFFSTRNIGKIVYPFEWTLK